MSISEPGYKVDYHLICTTWFSDNVLSGADLAFLWTTLSRLGQWPAETSTFCVGDIAPCDRKHSKVGSPELGDRCTEMWDKLLSAAASSSRRDAHNAILDSDINFTFQRKNSWHGHEVPSTVDFSVSGQVIEQVGADVILEVLRIWFNTVDSYAPICGLVDVAKPTDACAGMVYDTAFPATAPLARWIEQVNWLFSAAKKEDRLRGVYWGNYLGPKTLSRLGGIDAFMDTCTKNARRRDGTPNAHCWRFANGLFVSLCLNPVDCRPSLPSGIHIAAQTNLRWLVQELGSAGVLNPW